MLAALRIPQELCLPYEKVINKPFLYANGIAKDSQWNRNWIRTNYGVIQLVWSCNQSDGVTFCVNYFL